MIPWSTVFGFSSGKDAIRAVMASKNASPWKLAHIAHAMKERLRVSDAGRDLLNRYGETSALLPKLVYCLDNDCIVCRADGVYQSFLAENNMPGALREYLRFYSDGTVITGVTIATPEELSGWFYREHLGISPGEYRADIAQSGSCLLSVSFEIPISHGTMGYYGYMKADGTLCLSNSNGRLRTKRTYQFVRW